jgi:hypothetical protein
VWTRVERGPQFTAMQRRRILKLALSFSGVTFAAFLTTTTALADSIGLSLTPGDGQAGAAVSATVTYASPTGGCPVGMAIIFSWGANNVALGSAPLDTKCQASVTFVPRDKTAGAYAVTAMATQMQLSGQAVTQRATAAPARSG